MSHEAFQPTDEWPLQETYRRELHERIQKWGLRVAPLLEGFSEEDRRPREQFFKFLMTSVERGDRTTAETIQAVDGYARDCVEGPGPYGRGGGSIESTMGYVMCQSQFEGLFGIFEAGKQAASNA